MNNSEAKSKEYVPPRDLEDLEPLEQNGLVSIPIHIIRLARKNKLSATSIELASHIYALSTARGYCYAGDRYLAQCLGFSLETEKDIDSSKRAVRKILLSLESASILIRKELPGGGRSLTVAPMTATVLSADCHGPKGADCHGPNTADCHGPTYLYKKKDKYIKEVTQITRARESIDDPSTFTLTKEQEERVKLTYLRELPAGTSLSWALERGRELLEAWLVKRDPNTGRLNAETILDGHHEKIMKSWVLRDLLNEIEAKRRRSVAQGGAPKKSKLTQELEEFFAKDFDEPMTVTVK